MRLRLLRATVFGLFAVCASLGLVNPRAHAAEPIKVTIIHFNDVSEFVPANGNGGLAYAATQIQQLRARNINTIVTFGGNLLSPSPMSGLTRGNQMIDMLNSIGVDYAAVGRHDFDFGPTTLRERMADSNFTWLVTSVSEDDGSPFGGGSTTAIRRIGPFTIGFFSVISANTATQSNPGAHVHFMAPALAASQAVKALRAHGVDVVVALTNELLADDRALVDQVPGIDLVLGGNENALTEVWEKGIPIVKASRDAEVLAVVGLSISKEGDKVDIETSLNILPTRTTKPSAKLLAKMKAYQDDFASDLATPIATLDTSLDSRASIVRNAESTMADLFAEALRLNTGADVAIINGGGIRGDRLYPAGATLTRKDIQSELPFANLAVEMELTGQQIHDALENGVSMVKEGAGRFPQVSGMTYSFNLAKPVGQRIRDVTIGGSPLDLKKTYTVATNDFMANGGDGYKMMAGAKRLDGGAEKLMTDIVADYFISKDHIGQKADGRIRQIQ